MARGPTSGLLLVVGLVVLLGLVADLLETTLRLLLVAGNGGSAALAQHLVAELVGRFREDRPAFAALALAADASVLTALGTTTASSSASPVR